jgi:DNA-binding NarL/FixJ family response regulator
MPSTKEDQIDPKRIRLAIVDDMPEVIGMISRLCDLDPEIEIVATGSDGEAAIRIYEDACPDVLIMCVLMPRMDGITATREILSRHPGAKIIILTATDPDQTRGRAIQAGASAYISNPVSGDHLLETIHAADALG